METLITLLKHRCCDLHELSDRSTSMSLREKIRTGLSKIEYVVGINNSNAEVFYEYDKDHVLIRKLVFNDGKLIMVEDCE